jgi:hypothetical protein
MLPRRLQEDFPLAAQLLLQRHQSLLFPLEVLPLRYHKQEEGLPHSGQHRQHLLRLQQEDFHSSATLLLLQLLELRLQHQLLRQAASLLAELRLLEHKLHR